MTYPQYPAYGDGTPEWNSSIPTHWSEKRLRFVCKVNPLKSELDMEPETPVSFVPMDAVGEYGGLMLDQKKDFDEVGEGYTYFADGDVIVAKITPCFENGKGALAENLVSGVAFGTTELHVLRSGSDVQNRFLFYLTTSDPFRKIGKAAMYGAGGQKRISTDFVKDFRIGLPPMDEQRAICLFLDRETERIDALVDKKRRFLELLEEKRFAVITQAVTKGLDPTVPMKDSGIEWLGEIPAQWEVCRIKAVAQLESGHTPSKSVPEYWEDCDIPWVSLNDSKQLASSDFISETSHNINAMGLANSSARILPKGAVVFTRDATIGLAAITEGEMAVSQHLIAWLPGPRLKALYLLRVIDAMRPELERQTFGATIKTIGMDDVKKLVTPVPPFNEQERISSYIEQHINHLKSLKDKTKQAIERLQEYRASLITNAVTGKIDVRNETSMEQTQ